MTRARSSRSGPPDSGSGGYSDDELDYLLSAGSLGPRQRERILAAATESAPIAQPSPSRRPGSASWIGGLAVAVAAVAAALVLWSPGSLDRQPFRSKGSGAASTPVVDVECLGATLGTCPRGAVLAFSVHGAAAGMFLTASLETSRSVGRVWLLSNEQASAQAPGSSGVLARGARIPDHQQPGAYQIRVLVTRRPLSHEDALDPPLAALVSRVQFETTVPP
jgi:hypothetical protein